MLNVKQEAVNTNFKVIGLTRLGMKPESTAQHTDAPYHLAIFTKVVCFPPPKNKLNLSKVKRITLVYKEQIRERPGSQVW